MKPTLGPAQTLLISEETSLPVGLRTSIKSPLGTRVPAEFRYDDWRDIDGVKIPFTVEIENPFSGVMVLTFETALSE